MTNTTSNNDTYKTDVSKAISTIIGFLEEDDAKFNRIADECLEMYIQAHNLTMQVLIYIHNNHLVIRIPSFIRNVELRRLDVMLFITKVMGEILDIRFEISPDGKNLSASCQHILEDNVITRRQFDLAMMVVIQLVDDTYPKFMQLIYSDNEELGEAVEHSSASELEEVSIEEVEEEIEEDDKPADTGHKIN